MARNTLNPTHPKTSEFAYSRIKGAMRTAGKRVGLENSRLAVQAEQQLRTSKRQWDATERQIRTFIAENPEQALAIATGVGVAIGVTLASLSKRR